MGKESKKNTNINGYEYYRTTLSLGKNSEGKPVIKQFYGSSKQDAENMKAEYSRLKNLGLNSDLSKQSLSMAMDEWVWNILKTSEIKQTSFERYEGIYRNYIKDTDLGLLTISSIKKIEIQKYYNKLRQSGKSPSQLINLNKLLKMFFNYAEIEGYVVKNPCKGIKIPKNNEENIEEDDKAYESFTIDEINYILKNLGHSKLKYIVIFAVLTGARQGEILSLKKSDIHGDYIRINKTIKNNKVFGHDNSYSYKTTITRPKSENSIRSIPINDTLKSELKKLEKLVSEEKLKLGEAYHENNLLFPSETGTYWNARNLRRSWERALRSMNVPYKKFHALRHTFATLLIGQNRNLNDLSSLLGHSSTRTTEIYVDIFNENKMEDVQCLNELIS